MAIPKIYKYGIEITKPWTREMYAYNENIKSHMIKDIKFAINSIETHEDGKKLGKIIMASGYGYGFTTESIKADLMSNIDYVESWWLAEIWDDLITEGYVRPIFGEDNTIYSLIGFESKEEIKQLRSQFA